MKLLSSKVAIVTGASRGIGEAIADRFAENGAALVVVAIDSEEERLRAVCDRARSRGVEAIFVRGDIADPETSGRIVAAAIEKFDRIDIVVNCAGIVTRTPFESLSPADWHRVIEVNLYGPFYLSQKAIPALRKAGGGSIINMSSQMSKRPHPCASPSYEVSKSGINALTRHLAWHFAADRIRVNAIAPGSINTDMPKSMTPEAREALRNGIPMKRLGEPVEVADLAVFLASDHSAYITGTVIPIAGGTLMD
jgi:3-oxoacyl-[acyl-carrier protein] reductase